MKKEEPKLTPIFTKKEKYIGISGKGKGKELTREIGLFRDGINQFIIRFKSHTFYYPKFLTAIEDMFNINFMDRLQKVEIEHIKDIIKKALHEINIEYKLISADYDKLRDEIRDLKHYNTKYISRIKAYEKKLTDNNIKFTEFKKDDEND